MKLFKKFVSMCTVALGRSEKEVDLVASDSTNKIDLGSHGFKGKDYWVKIKVFFKVLFKRKHDLVIPDGEHEINLGVHLVKFGKFKVRKFHCYNL
jgi:hypothetical protein